MTGVLGNVTDENHQNGYPLPFLTFHSTYFIMGITLYLENKPDSTDWLSWMIVPILEMKKPRQEEKDLPQTCCSSQLPLRHSWE